MIRLFVIEDHLTVIISSLRFLFRPQRDGIQVTGFASTLTETIKKANPGEFDLFILDLYIPGHLPIENIRTLKKHFPEKPIVIYTYEKSSSWKSKMMQEGAMSYITKDSSREELKIALQKAIKGEIFNPLNTLSPELPDTEDKMFQEPMKLSDVQLDIVKLLSEGLMHEEISSRTGYSRSLIEKILKNMRTSFKVRNNIELIKLLSKTGLV
jgi:DNA-binding NarL/FixJ family response regulator